MAGQNGESAVHLLGQYDAGQLMRQRHAPKRKKQVGALACDRRPSIRRSDGEHQALNALIADAAELRGELIGRVLLATTIQQDGISWSASGLAIQPIDHRRLRVEQLRVTRKVSCGALYIVGNQTVARLRFRAGAARADGSKGDLHLIELSTPISRLVTGASYFVTEIPSSITDW